VEQDLQQQIISVTVA